MDKKALAIIFAVTKFRQDLIGHHFVILPNHKPLELPLCVRQANSAYGFSPHSALVTVIECLLLQHLSLTRQAHANADTLSRLLLATTPVEEQPTGDTVLLFKCLQVSPLSIVDIRCGMNRDPLLSKVRTFVLQGWPMH